MTYIFTHTMFGFCWWDLPAAIILIAVAAVFIVRHRKMKKQKEDLEDQLADLEARKVPISTDEV